MVVKEQLWLDEEGIAQLRARLREANGDDREFDARFDRLMAVLYTILTRLEHGFGDEIERVMAVGDWAQDGIDLRALPYDDVIIHIVLRSDERPFDLYWRIADEIFDNLHDEDIFVQFDLETLPEWQLAVSVAKTSGREGALGIPLLIRG